MTNACIGIGRNAPRGNCADFTGVIQVGLLVTNDLGHVHALIPDPNFGLELGSSIVQTINLFC